MQWQQKPTVNPTLLMYRSYDNRVFVTGTNPCLYPARDNQPGSSLKKYVESIFYRYNNKKSKTKF